MSNVDIDNHCQQIIRQINSLLKRRNDNRLIFIKSQVERIIDNDNKDSIKEICDTILRHLDIPMRRSDDWKIEIIKHKIKNLCKFKESAV